MSSKRSSHLGAMVRRLLYVTRRIREVPPTAPALSFLRQEGEALVWALEALGDQAGEKRRAAIDNAIKLHNIATLDTPEVTS